MRSFLISIRPRWVIKIFNGDKTIEIRRDAPKDWKDYLSGKTKIKPKPMTGYIYCTHGDKLFDLRKENMRIEFSLSKSKSNNTIWSIPPIINGKVVAKFTLREVERIKCETYPSNDSYQFRYEYFPEKSTEDEILRKSCIIGLEPYLDGCEGYAWHISDLVIFDKPKKLWEFEKLGSYNNPAIKCKKKEQGICNRGKSPFTGKWVGCEKAKLIKAPRSWCYVETREKKK